MTGKPTTGLYEKGHGMGPTTKAHLDRAVMVAQGLMAQAVAAADEGNLDAVRMATRDAFERVRGIYTLAKHAERCEQRLPCDCDACMTPQERIADYRAQIDALNRAGLDAYQKHVGKPAGNALAENIEDDTEAA